MINSILDNDLYKFSMMQAIAHHYPRVEVEYEFINRNKTPFPAGFDKRLRQAVDAMQELQLTTDEEKFLRDRCYYLTPAFIDMLRGYRYDPKQVQIRQVGGQLFASVKSPHSPSLWYRNVLWEVPLMAMISELYFEMMEQPPVVIAANSDALDWKAALGYKLRRMSDAGCVVSDFGTRRRHSYMVHDHVVKTMASVKCCSGTSNVHLAHKYNLTPIGTMAHEWIMAHAAMYGYRRATAESLKAWIEVYGGELGIALPDTFTTEVFLRDFNVMYAKLFDGARHDSGDWKWFTDLMIAHWKSLRIDPSTKAIVYSDGLNADQAIEIQKYAEGKVLPRFGIGTNLTNSVGRTPLNMVIKLTNCNGRPTVKLSDSPGKELGPPEAVSHCKYDLGLQ